MPPDPTDAAGQQSESALWARLRQDGDEEARSRLLELHVPYARVVAASYYAKRHNDEIEFDDYLQLASVGLIESIDRFDPDAGAQFRTFAAHRMHGALISGIERMTEKQQQIAARRRLLDQRKESIKAQLGEVPTGQQQLMKYAAEAGIAFALAWLLDGTGMVSTEDADQADPMPFYRSDEIRQLREELGRLVQELPEQERKVLHSHYFQEMSFEDIASGMQLTRGRISQIHRKALARLLEELRRRRSLEIAW